MIKSTDRVTDGVINTSVRNGQNNDVRDDGDNIIIINLARDRLKSAAVKKKKKKKYEI